MNSTSSELRDIGYKGMKSRGVDLKDYASHIALYLHQRERNSLYQIISGL
jgi:hypothetical protein